MESCNREGIKRLDRQAYFWVAFIAVTGGLLVLDLAVFHRRSRDITMRDALTWSAVWVGSALSFNLALLPWRGSETALQFLTGYLIEFSLSIDNLFVFMVLFGQFAVPPAHQHRVLFWGVIGAIVMRVAVILAGGALVERFHWILYLFGAFLLATGAKMLFSRGNHDAAPAGQIAMTWLSRRLPVSPRSGDGRFLVRDGGRWQVTQLFIVLLSIELADVMFAVDSVPAIFAVTTDPFVVITSNVFAILGLRSFYFALHGLMGRLRYLKYGLAAVLMVIGGKVLLGGVYPVPITASLVITIGIMAVAVMASLWASRSATPRVSEKPARRLRAR